MVGADVTVRLLQVAGRLYPRLPRGVHTVLPVRLARHAPLFGRGVAQADLGDLPVGPDRHTVGANGVRGLFERVFDPGEVKRERVHDDRRRFDCQGEPGAGRAGRGGAPSPAIWPTFLSSAVDTPVISGAYRYRVPASADKPWMFPPTQLSWNSGSVDGLFAPAMICRLT